jgi:hypothetical protein
MPEVAGLVLVEADAQDVEPKQMQEDSDRGLPKILKPLRECRDAIAGGKPLPPLPARPGQPPRTCAQQFFRGLPEEAWSPEFNAKLLQHSSEYVPFDEPDAVIDAIREVHEQSRNSPDSAR